MKSSIRVRATTAVITGILFSVGSLSLGQTSANASTVSHEVAMLGCLSQRMVRPASYILGCGSGTYVITNVHWTTWNSTNARGTGKYVLNTCTSTCSDDNNVAYPATFNAHGIRSTTSGMVYQSLTITYLKAGHRTSVTWALPPF
ncbi:MAG TPA: hypothetical protein VGZ68_04445 [Acidimicrobiales bacterium]|jgi:hypothetical protein|nr:hypothetical protein [Acidimicrobiales bacterium]